MYKTIRSPMIVQWEVTDRCNKNCVHCYNHWQLSQNDMVTEESVNYETSVQEIIKNDVFLVIVTGGEPLLVFDRIFPYLKKLRAANVDVSINSNLSLLTHKIALKLKEIGINSFLTSLPGHTQSLDYQITQSTRSWEQTSQGIRLAIQEGFHVTANMVVSKINLPFIYDTGRYAKELGVNVFSVTKASQPTNCPDFTPFRLSRSDFRQSARELLRVKKDFDIAVDSIEGYPVCSIEDPILRQEVGFSRICTAGRTFCVISTDGTKRPCIVLSDKYVGDLNTAWLAMDEFRSNDMIPSECNNCPRKFNCMGGCKAEAKHVNGSYRQPDPYCDFAVPIENLVDGQIKESIKDLPTVLYLNPKAKIRQENFGGIIYVSPRYWSLINEDLYQFMKTINYQPFSTRDLSLAMSITDEQAKQTVLFLAKRHLLLI